MKKKGRRFFQPVASKPAKARTAKPSTGTPKSRRFFIAPSMPVWDAESELRQRFNLPPREYCEDCGARARLQDDGMLISEAHASDCYYAGWPPVVKDCKPRPSVAQEGRLPATRCSVCRCPVLNDVSYDRKHHLWWCSWWDAHPGITPF